MTLGQLINAADHEVWFHVTREATHQTWFILTSDVFGGDKNVSDSLDKIRDMQIDDFWLEISMDPEVGGVYVPMVCVSILELGKHAGDEHE